MYAIRSYYGEERLERALRQAALWEEAKDILGRPGASLSGGQQQRLCIARVLALQPEVLLMDEPTSALDPIATARIEELLHELRGHYTVVIVTHNIVITSYSIHYTKLYDSEFSQPTMLFPDYLIQ